MNVALPLSKMLLAVKYMRVYVLMNVLPVLLAILRLGSSVCNYHVKLPIVPIVSDPTIAPFVMRVSHSLITGASGIVLRQPAK